MSKWNESDYLAYWPKAIPFPYSVKRSQRPVPNSTAVNWPQSQFAPLYNPAGSPSFNPYSYTQNDVSYSRREPVYSTSNFYPYARSGVGPGGDTSALPSDLGDPMAASSKSRDKRKATSQGKGSGSNGLIDLLTFGLLSKSGRKNKNNARHKHVQPPANEREAKRRLQQAVEHARQRADVQIYRQGGATGLRLTPTQIQIIRVRSVIHALQKQPSSQRVKHHIRTLTNQYARLMDKRRTEVLAAHHHASVRPVATRANPGVHRMGMMATGQMIEPGVPAEDNVGAPPSMLTPEPSDYSATGLGDGFAYELAPLQASAPYGDLGGDCGCAKNNEGSAGLVAGLGAGMLAVVAIPSLVVVPWVIGQFKPEWSYGKRVAAGLLGGWAAGTALSLARG